ncbi:MAG TPA: hypothetical protein VNS34_20140 [Rhizobiaceae bacterium]|nr:hypothetical protein [Rhizobiaceae bacterium]
MAIDETERIEPIRDGQVNSHLGRTGRCRRRPAGFPSQFLRPDDDGPQLAQFDWNGTSLSLEVEDPIVDLFQDAPQGIAVE